MSQFGLLVDAEQLQYDQQCAIRNLLLLHELLDQDIIALETSGAPIPAGRFRELWEAMCSAAGTLSRLNQELGEAVEEEFKRNRGIS